MLKIEAVKTAQLEIGGKVRTLKYTMAAWRSFEEELGVDNYVELLQPFFEGKKSLGAKQFNALLWCGLLHAEPDLKPETVAGWYEMMHIPPILEVVAEVIGEQGDTDSRPTKAAAKAAK